MASAEDVQALRRMVGEPTTATYADDALSAILDRPLSLDGAAAVVWREKAAAVADLVNTSESGSSRSLGDLHRNYLSHAAYYDKRVTDAIVVEDTSSAPFTVPIQRS